MTIEVNSSSDTFVDSFPGSKAGYDECVEALNRMANKLLKSGRAKRYGVFLKRIRMGSGEKRWALYVRDRTKVNPAKEQASPTEREEQNA